MLGLQNYISYALLVQNEAKARVTVWIRRQLCRFPAPARLLPDLCPTEPAPIRVDAECECIAIARMAFSDVVLQASIVLVTGYSWIDGHLSVLSIGIGWDVACRRILLVLIGLPCISWFCARAVA